jgi:hypothetical protein
MKIEVKETAMKMTIVLFTVLCCLPAWIGHAEARDATFIMVSKGLAIPTTKEKQVQLNFDSLYKTIKTADSAVERLDKHRETPFVYRPKEIVDGVVHHIQAFDNVPIIGVAGYMTVKRPDGSLLRFKMYSYSLILICNGNGCYAGNLKQLKVGWPVSAVYLTQEDGGASPHPTPGPDGIDEVSCDNVYIRLETEEYK